MIRLISAPALALAAVVLLSPARVLAEDAAADETLIKQAGFSSDPEGLLRLFRKLTPAEADRKRMHALVGQLGSDRYDDREEASRLLLQWQLAALEPLRQGLDHADAEVRRRS